MTSTSEKLTEEDKERLLRDVLKLKPRKAEEQEYTPPEALPKYTPLDFVTAYEMLKFFSPEIQDGTIKLHSWQKETLEFLSQPCSKDNAIRYQIAAANGSGKDAYVNAPIAVFKLLCRVRSRTVITSSSNTQLKLQTESYILSLCNKINTKLADMGICQKAISMRKFPVTHITCNITGSEIIMFTTDETGRAEGWHPFPDYPKGEVTLMVNEAKTVPDFIFDAFSRCTYTLFLEISSPGKTFGKFYFNHQKAIHHPAPYVPGSRYFRRVTAYDCEHIPKEKIESEKQEWGEGSFLFRSKNLALFTTVGETTVISQDSLDRCLAKGDAIPKICIGVGKHAGVDLGGLASRGGDENVIAIYDENEFQKEITFFCTDADEMMNRLEYHFLDNGLDKSSQINIDEGKIGGAIISMLSNKGWKVGRVCNQGAALRKTDFLNRGAELWFNYGRLIAEALIRNLPSRESNEKLYTQFISRKYGDSGHQGKLFLQDKKEAKKEGSSSPDRADAHVLAFDGITIADFKAGKIVAGLQRAGIIQTIDIAKQNAVPEFIRQHINRVKQKEGIDTNGKSFNPGSILRGIYGRR